MLFQGWGVWLCGRVGHGTDTGSTMGSEGRVMMSGICVGASTSSASSSRKSSQARACSRSISSSQSEQSPRMKRRTSSIMEIVSYVAYGSSSVWASQLSIAALLSCVSNSSPTWMLGIIPLC